ncbi:unnamed protein product [Calypogeia fissa]
MALCAAAAASSIRVGLLLPQPATASVSQGSSISRAGLSSSFTASCRVAPSLSCSFAVARPVCHVARRRVVIRAMADKEAAPVKKKEDSAKKRARLGEQRRLYNKSRKTQIKTRMKKVFLALDSLKKSGAENPEDIKPIEKLIAEAYSIIDKSVKVGTLHRNTGGNRKSRLARAKKAVEIQLGWFTPTPAA